MKLSRLNAFAVAVMVAAGAMLAKPAQAAETEPLLACTESQKAEIREWIADTCDGSGSAWVYCSWTGLWQINSYSCA
jgi:hypothetical protein